MICRLRKIYLLLPFLILCFLYFHIALLGSHDNRKFHTISQRGSQSHSSALTEERKDFQSANLRSNNITFIQRKNEYTTEEGYTEASSVQSLEITTTEQSRRNLTFSKGAASRKETQTNTKKFKRVCPVIPPDLLGKMKVDVKSNVTWEDVRKELKEKPEAGRWFPKWCFARDRVVIVIPFRDRHQHLIILLKYLIPMLQRQLLDFRIFVPEQLGNGTFNKGRLMNAAVKEAMSVYDFRCVIFHDVDLVPEDDRNMYSCKNQPFHLSISIDQWKYIYMYDKLVGGALNLRKDHLLCVNGYSNGYWGWGAEDDDMAERIQACNLKIVRPPGIVGRYKSIPHVKRGATKDQDKNNGKLLNHAVKHYKSVKERMKDGLSNVPYKIVKKTEFPLFTYLLLDVGNSTL